MGMVEILVLWYLATVFGFYMGALTVNIDSYRNASVVSMLRGVVGAFIWPFFTIIVIYYGTKGLINNIKERKRYETY